MVLLEARAAGLSVRPAGQSAQWPPGAALLWRPGARRRRLSKLRLSGNERLNSLNLDLIEEIVLDFWQWAFSDLQANSIRGIFAEWLVAKLLDIPLTVRDSWAESDLITPESIKIEVKTKAVLMTRASGGKGKSKR